MVKFLVVLVFVSYVLAVTWRPATLLSLSLAFYPLEQLAQAMDPFFVTYPRTLNYVMAGIAGWAFIVSWIQRGNPFRHLPLAAWLIYSLLLLSAVSYFWALDRAGTKEVLVGFLPYLTIDVLIVPLCIRDWKDVRTAANWIIYFGFPVAVILLVATGVNRAGREIELMGDLLDRYGRAHKGGNPLTVASFGGALMLVSIFLRTQGLQRVLEFARWGIVAAGLLLIVRSGSRGQFGSVMIVAGLVFTISIVMGGKVTRAMLTVLAAGLFALIVPWALQFSALRGRFDVGTWTSEFAATRVRYCVDVLEYWVNNSEIGNFAFGLGNSACWAIINTYPHVVPVELLVELGVVGLLIYSTCVLLVLTSSIRSMWQLRHMPLEQSVVFTFFALWVFFSLLTLKQGTFMMSFNWMSLTVILARLGPIMQHARSTQLSRSRRKVPWIRVPPVAPDPRVPSFS